MIGLLPILARWRLGLGIACGLAFLMLALAANHYRHAYHAEKAMRAADKAAYVTAQAEAAIIAKRALDASEAKYAHNAMEADRAHQTDLADARAATRDYIAAHRVRSQAASSATGPAPAPSESGGPDLPASVPADSVMVSAGDVQACSNAVTYAIGAHNWAMTLNK